MTRIQTWLYGATLLLPAVVPASSQAQDRTVGKVARSSAGEIGQRQTRDTPQDGVEPMARIDSRIQNRIQSRIPNRIDRYYDPQANVANPFAIANERARAAGRPRRQ